MLKLVNCQSCKLPHFDHYECGDCGYNFGFVNPHMNYCPNCGSKLTKRAADLLKRQQQKAQSAVIGSIAHKIRHPNASR
jgi:predicted RNA-binding Zn-ribbon protein involved in translation (DUF1610 family)